MTTQPTLPSAKEMARIVWKNKTINEFIENYNEVSGLGSQKLRIEKYSPYIYVIVINKPPIAIKGKEVLLAKVGFTQISVEKGTDNRMEKVHKEIEEMLATRYKESDSDVSILFTFPIHALTIDPYRDIEKRIREKVGFRLPKGKAEEWFLPVKTEWVLTTQEYIKKIKNDVEVIKKEKRVLSTKIFNSEAGDNKACDLPRALGMKDEEILEVLKELKFPLEKKLEINPPKTTDSIDATPEINPPKTTAATASIDATPEAKATKKPKKTSSKDASKTAAKGHGEESVTKTPKKTSSKDASKTASKGHGEKSSAKTSDEQDK